MSLIGVDVGSSSVKVCAYNTDGAFITGSSRPAVPLHPGPGLWEQDPLSVRDAVLGALAEVAADNRIIRDRPVALAVSASGRENFPMLRDGTPLGNNIMGADIRGAELETPPEGISEPEPWELACGHMRERMDPVFRFLWWKMNHPDIMERAELYPDWHGYITYLLCGENVSDPSLVGRWACYDIMKDRWDNALVDGYGIKRSLLPIVYPAGTPIERITPTAAKLTGLPADTLIVTGGHDLNCCALGAGASDIDTACLISGSYENMLIPTLRRPTSRLLRSGLSITPHFGRMKRSVYAICPTGNAVVNWVRDTLGLSIAGLESELADRTRPSDVMMAPYLSGAMLHWNDGRKLRGTVTGLTLATSRLDIAQAAMESIAYDHVKTMALLDRENIRPTCIRATGGGIRSRWWTQLKCDLMNMPIETSTVEEPGTFGAALLAGVGAGVVSSIECSAQTLSRTGTVYEPNEKRALLYRQRMEDYDRFVEKMLEM